jgi:hypothetical protein
VVLYFLSIALAWLFGPKVPAATQKAEVDGDEG